MVKVFSRVKRDFYQKARAEKQLQMFLVIAIEPPSNEIAARIIIVTVIVTNTIIYIFIHRN